MESDTSSLSSVSKPSSSLESDTKTKYVLGKNEISGNTAVHIELSPATNGTLTTTTRKQDAYDDLACQLLNVRHSSYAAHARDLVLWQKPVTSGLILGVSVAMIISLKYFSTLAVLSFWGLIVMLASLMYKVTRGFMITCLGYAVPDLLGPISRNWEISDELADTLDVFLKYHLNPTLKLIHDVLFWQSAAHSMMTVLTLLLTYNLGKAVNISSLMLTVIVTAFTLPPLYWYNKAKIDTVLGRAKKASKNTFVKVKEMVPSMSKGTATSKKVQ